jgi:membrane protease YdiL (CAAX protease family)
MRAHLRGHLLLFDERTAPALDAGAGVRLLLVAVLLEVARLVALASLYPAIPLWLLVPSLLLLALLAVPRLAGLRLADLGLAPWRDWSLVEKSYLLQVIVLVSIVFPLMLGLPSTRAADGGAIGSLAGVFVTYLCFGFYQEVVYRGMVQTALVPRWGTVAGVLVANVLYTFGPLHWRYFESDPSRAVPMLASIFLIGLFFGALYARSGNLWIVGILHAIGNAYIVSTVGMTR